MPDYKIYAVQLDHAFKAAREKYAATYSRLKKAEDARAAAKLLKDKWFPGEADIKRENAEFEYLQAKAAFAQVEATVWDDFDRQRKEIRANLESTIAKTSQVRPEDIDRDGLTLLESGIMTPDELGAFLERYTDNPTMKRLTAQHIKKELEATKDPAARQQFYALYQQSGSDDVMSRWKDLETAAHTCSGQAHGKGTPSYVLSISNKWEQLTEQAIQEF